MKTLIVCGLLAASLFCLLFSEQVIAFLIKWLFLGGIGMFAWMLLKDIITDVKGG